MQIRDCAAGDFEPLVALLQQLWPDKRLDRGALRRVFERALESSDQGYLCAVEGGQVVGFCSMSLENSLWVEGRLAIIEEVVVDARHRGHGIGTTLLNAAVAWARSKGARRVELDSAHHRTEAHRFYARNGFENRGLVFSKPLL